MKRIGKTQNDATNRRLQGGGIGAATKVGGARERDSFLKPPLQVKKPNSLRGHTRCKVHASSKTARGTISAARNLVKSREGRFEVRAL
jgi:hypothetical protein